MNEFSSPNTLEAPLFIFAQSHSRNECRTCTDALEDARRRPRARRNAAQMRLRLESARGRESIDALHNTFSARAARATSRANICGGAGKKISGSRTMDLFTVVIIVTMLVTVATMFLGVLTMSGGGSTDKSFSTPLMWARVGFQALTLLLLFVAIRLR
jgi:hypothetical protein